MSTVFVDAYFYTALLDQNDQHHAQVLKYAHERKAFMVTTRWVLAEVANALSDVQLRSATARFLASLETKTNVKIIQFSDELFQRGLKLYASRPDKAWSLTDCISFVVMADEGLHEALTGDRHFAQAGFVPLFA
jgi:predicted nucleic acid-binding protein